MLLAVCALVQTHIPKNDAGRTTSSFSARETKDPLFVKEFLGHKKLDTTLLYIQLAKTIFNEKADEFHVKVAAKPEEIRQLLEAGFE